MSIVAVHGPNTWGVRGAGGAGTGRVYETAQIRATADMTNGNRFFFEAVNQQRIAADYDWTSFGTGATPALQNDSKGPVTVNYSSTGSKTVTLTIAAGAGPPAGGTYTITVLATGTGPRALDEEGEPEQGEVVAQFELEAADQEAPIEEAQSYDPSDHTVDDVVAYAREQDSEEVGRILELEQSDKNRSTLVEALEEMLPLDPADYTVDALIEYAEDNPEEIEGLLEAERQGKGRRTLIARLEELQAEQDE